MKRRRGATPRAKLVPLSTTAELRREERFRRATTLLVSSPEDFRAYLRIVGSSIAEPAWFSIPVDAVEDSESYTISFDVAGRDHDSLVLEGTDMGLAIRGPDGPIRKCLFPATVDPQSLQTDYSANVLRVRVLKKRLAPDVPGGAGSGR